jgi:hypothetical protein
VPFQRPSTRLAATLQVSPACRLYPASFASAPRDVLGWRDSVPRSSSEPTPVTRRQCCSDARLVTLPVAALLVLRAFLAPSASGHPHTAFPERLSASNVFSSRSSPCFSWCLVGAARAVPSQFFLWATLFCFCFAILASRIRIRASADGTPSKERFSAHPFFGLVALFTSLPHPFESALPTEVRGHIAAVQGGGAKQRSLRLLTRDLSQCLSAKRPPLGLQLEID